MSRSTTYNGDAITFNFANVIIESGRGEDTFLELAQAEDDFTYKAGIDGEGVFSNNRNTYTVATLTLMQTAAGNGLLSAIHNVSKLAGGLPAPLYVEDRKGTSKLISGTALILKTPDETFAKEAGSVVWMIGIHGAERFVGGHY